MNQKPSREETLFNAAAALPIPAERAAFLDRECAGDAALRAVVEALLRASDGAGGSFLGAPTVTMHPGATIALPGGGGGTIALPAAAGGTIVLGGAPSKAGPTVTLPPEEYHVGGEIARGGMGSILEAEDRKLGRKVAMKVMKLEASASDYARARFVREATVLARLEHPNIVPIHELGWDAENRLFYTMKLVQGRTLQAVINGLKERDPDFIGHYTLDRLLTIFRKICDALSMAHAKGVIHRDLKPENVMVGEFGEVLVMDWGIAKILADANQVAEESAQKAEATAAGTAGKFRELADEELRKGSAELTLDGTVMGTPHYMSPEQADGRVTEIDQQSDVFSLGAILYALITLHTPVEADSPYEVLELIKRGEIRPPTTYNLPTPPSRGRTATGPRSQRPGSEETPGESPDLSPTDALRAGTARGPAVDPKKYQPLPHCPGGKVPSALSAVTMRALTVDKARRYATVAAFAADIEKYQSGFATSAEQAGLFTQLRLLVQRHRREFAIGFAAWLVITALAVWFVISSREKERRAVAEAERAAKAEQSAKAAEALAVQERESARQSSATANLALAEAARREGDGSAMQAALNDVPDDLRDSTWSYLLAQSDTSIARLRLGNSDIVSAVPHPLQPGVFAVGNAAGEVALLEVRTGARLLSFKPVFPPNSGGQIRLALSPDGERIAVGRNGSGGIVIHSARDGSKLRAWDAPTTERLEFSPDGELLLQVYSDQVHVWNAGDGTTACVFPSEPTGSNVRAIFSPDSQLVLVADYNNKKGMPLVRARGGELVRLLPRLRFTVRAMLMRKDGRALAVGDGGAVDVVDLQDGHVVSEFQTGAQRTDHVALTPDGETVVTGLPLADGRQSLRLWDAATGRPVQTLLGGSGAIGTVSVHPLSGELVVAGPNARAWSLTGTPARWTLRGTIDGTAFFGGDDLIFGNVSGSGFVLHKLEAGTPVVQWKSASGTYRLAVVSADGRVAAVSHTVGREPILMLRNPGPAVEQFASLPRNLTLDAMSLSPTGDRLALILGGRGTAAVYDPVTGMQPVKLQQTDVKRRRQIGWLDGRRLLGLVTARADRGNPGSEERVVIWDTTTGKLLQTATNRTAMDVLAIAPDGRRFAEAGADKLVRIRDAATLAVQQEFRAHDGPITALAWHPTKPILATASEDLSIRLWNLETGERLEEFRGPSLPSVGLAFSPGGRRLACAVKDNGTRIWEPESLSPKSGQDAERATDGWKDLLASLTPATVAQTGNGWRMNGGALFSPGKQYATLPLAGNPSGTSYQVRVKLRQLSAKNVFHLALPVADRMVGFDLDGTPADGFYTTLLRVNDKLGKNVPGALHGKQVKDSEQHDLEVSVRLDGTNATITTTLDGQPLYEWTGPTAALSQHENWKTPPGTLALGSIAADWVVYEVKVKRLGK
ncbi:MAG: protein kinase [Verrucomicrobia bacterium]|nr:protein kinase [Verrucomicrobiota bacterium]